MSLTKVSVRCERRWAGLAVWLFIGVVLSPTRMPAQLSGRVLRETPSPGESQPATEARQVDQAFVDGIVARFQPDATERARIVGVITQLLNLGKVDPATISNLIAETKNVLPESAEQAANVLIGAVQGNGLPITKRLLGETVFTSAAASVGTDRALAMSTLVNYGGGRLTLRFVTAAAVSNAESNKVSTASTTPSQSTTSDDYRTRTGDLLTMMQAGGNGVLRLVVDASRNPNELRGFHASLMADAGGMGQFLNANTQARLSTGSAVEASWHSRTIDPVGLFISLRGGGRWAKDGIVTGEPNNRWLAFGQFLLEFHLPGGKVPLGISGNLVNKDLRTYALPLHVYTDLGK